LNTIELVITNAISRSLRYEESKRHYFSDCTGRRVSSRQVIGSYRFNAEEISPLAPGKRQLRATALLATIVSKLNATTFGARILTLRATRYSTEARAILTAPPSRNERIRFVPADYEPCCRVTGAN